MQLGKALLGLVVLFGLSLALGSDIGPDYIHDKIYSNDFGAPCVRLIGRDGPIGCSTSRTGTSGWLYPVLTSQEIVEYTTNAPTGDIVVVLASELFIPETVALLKGVSELKGILVLPGAAPPSFSPDLKYPNRQYGLYPNSTMIWNTNGTGWNYELQDIAIFELYQQQTADKYLEYALTNKNTTHFPKWAVELKAWMYAENDFDPTTCLRRGHCLPLGGRNIWGAFNGLESLNNQRLLLISASFDSNAFFHDLATGANADISGAVALLGAVQALASVDRGSWIRQPVFTLFTGEAYGFIGSKAFVNDLYNFSCTDAPKNGGCNSPYRIDLSFLSLHLDMIDAIIELNQIGHFASNSEATVYPHVDNQGEEPTLILDSLQIASLGSGVDVSTDVPKGQELPPSSLMSFLGVDRSLAGVVLTDHQSEYRNPYYHSRFDSHENINIQAVCNVSRLLARTAFLLGVNSTQDANGLDFDQLVVDCDQIAQLIDCFTVNQYCPLVQELYPTLITSGELPPPTNYVGVYSRKSYSFATSVLYDWLVNATATTRSDVACNKTSQCGDRSFWVCVSGTCIAKSSYNVHLHEAISPGIAYDHTSGTFSVVDDSPQWPLWTESYWETPYLTVYLMDNTWVGPAVFVAGIIEFGLALGAVKALQRVLPTHYKLN